MRILFAILAAFTACFGAVAAQAQAVAKAPEWARPILLNDADAISRRSAGLVAPENGIAARLVIAPAQGGVARLVRYASSPDTARLTVWRFTGHIRNGWLLWGGETPVEIAVTPQQKAQLDQALRNSSAAGAFAGEGSSVERPCADGDFAYIELSTAARAQAFERRCALEGAAGAAIRALSNAAGGRNEEELMAAGVAEIMAADKAFSKAARDEGVAAAMATFAADEGRVFLSRSPAVAGRAAIAQQYANWDPAATLQWEPAGAEISGRGDFGYSWGTWRLTQAGRDPASGHYVSVWRRDPDGAWRFLANIGN